VKAAALAAGATGEYGAPSGAPGAGHAGREAAGGQGLGLKCWAPGAALS
jgi:hypothetical protein